MASGFLSPVHVVLLLVVVLLLFGAKRLPEFGRSLGSGLREFKHSIDPESHQEPTTLPAAPTSAAAQPPAPPALSGAAPAQPAVIPPQSAPLPAEGESAEVAPSEQPS
jgi:sec-independent protein translocase protein TatA